MRLLDLQHFDVGGDQIPTLINRDEAEQRLPDQPFKYAILSHRWQREEVTFEDLKYGTARSRAGYDKLIQSIRLAHQGKHKYLWVDTCCINKDSSAELSEAINSMYLWYQNAEVCFAYLHDVAGSTKVNHMDWFANKPGMLGHSEWFTRGWTLQELLAPRRIVFYDRDWQYLADRASLGPQISHITRVPISILDGTRSLESMSVAARMSWAVGRRTTRVEDIAYSLMGIFSVNMPLLYGEGARAFTRLQIEIMNQSDDFSLFAWRREKAPLDERHGILADSPEDFKFSGDIVTYKEWRDFSTFSMTSKGLSIQLGIAHDRAMLPCTVLGKEDGFLSISIEKLPDGGNRYVRTRLTILDAMHHEGNPVKMYFPQTVAIQRQRPLAYHKIRLSVHRDQACTYKPKKVVLSRGCMLDSPSPNTAFDTIITNANGRSEHAINLTTMRWRIGVIMLFESKSSKTWSEPAAPLVLLIGTRSNGSLGFDVRSCNEQTRRELTNSPYSSNALLNAGFTYQPVYPPVFDTLYSPVELGSECIRPVIEGKKSRKSDVTFCVRSAGATADDSTILDVEVNNA